MIDHGKVIAEGTPVQLKASVGTGALHVRLLDPAQRPDAELAEHGSARDPRGRLGRPLGGLRHADRGAEAVAD